ncbi:hypothetical protein [Nocardia carnea]|uniref:hypothetical protein n=1 Tax=Nocardia carnea TaxID=37328 RepID=UPI002454761F|nr:hypothetical protein [Nocardia carnea]
MRARRSTLILAGSWIATFVLYLFVKPDDIVRHDPAPAPVQQVPAVVLPGR